MTELQIGVGARIAHHRRRLKLSQEEFASRIERSPSWVSQVERGVRRVDRLSVLQKVADVLSVSVAELQGSDTEESSASAPEYPEAAETLRLALTGHPALEAVITDNPRPATEQQFSDLVAKHEVVWEYVHASRYGDLGPLLAALIPGLEQVVRLASDEAIVRQARELLTDTYQAAAAMMAKLGETDAAWIAADRAAFVAEEIGWPLAVAASSFRMAHVFLGLRQIPQAQSVATSAVAALAEHIREHDDVAAKSLQGGFLLILAVASARENERPRAHEYLNEARRLADAVGEDRNDFGTEFGPTNVAIHAVSIAVDLGDAGQALDLANGVDTSGLSPERQARFLLDISQAHAMRRQIGESLRALQEAERLTPEQIRGHKLARDTTRDLIQLSGTRPSPELHELAERFGVL